MDGDGDKSVGTSTATFGELGVSCTMAARIDCGLIWVGQTKIMPLVCVVSSLAYRLRVEGENEGAESGMRSISLRLVHDLSLPLSVPLSRPVPGRFVY